jgi:hypothetical protein
MRFLASCATAFVLLCPAARAEEPKAIELTIHPRAIETPVLKYRLLPAEAELKPGNAVPILLRMVWEQTPWMSQEFPKLKDWDSRPLDAPEWTAAVDGVLPFGFYSQMRRAAFRRDAAWEYPIGETSSVFTILLPDVQGLRNFLAHGLSARIRYHLSRGELHQAREGILVGLANARQMAKGPFYVNQLVALAVDRAMLDRIGELISQQNSPNLYWALSALPASLIELDRAASLEGSAFVMTFPAANELDRPRDQAEWRRMAEQLIEVLEQIDEVGKERATTADYIARWAKVARAELPRRVMIAEEQLASMPDEEAAIRWYVDSRLSLEDKMAAVMVLRPLEAWRMLYQLRKEINTMHEKAGTKQVSGLEATRIYVSAWSVSRRIQSLRIVEAVRHYLATHDGKLPPALKDIRDIPVPIDPMTDQPFHWHVDGNRAVLKAPSLAAEVPESGWETTLANTLEYRLQVK